MHLFAALSALLSPPRPGCLRCFNCNENHIIVTSRKQCLFLTYILSLSLSFVVGCSPQGVKVIEGLLDDAVAHGIANPITISRMLSIWIKGVSCYALDFLFHKTNHIISFYYYVCTFLPSVYHIIITFLTILSFNFISGT